MTTGVVVTHVQEARSLVHWAALLGRARAEGVVVFFFGSKLGEPSAVEIVTDGDEDLEGANKAIQEVVAMVEETVAALPRAEDPDDAKIEEPSFTPVRIDGGDPVETVLREVGARAVKLLVVGRRQRGSTEPSESDVFPLLFERAPCSTLMIRPGADPSESAAHVLVPTSGGPHARVAFEIAGDLAAASDGDVTALYVQKERGSDAEAFGLHALRRVTARAPSRHRDRIREKVVLARSVREGVLAEAADYDLVLLGSSSRTFVQRLLFRTVPEKLLSGPEGTSVAVVRRAATISARFERAFLHLVTQTVPQLARPDRVALVERLRTASELNFDFVFLTCLSTFIAALGLIADNGAVVIGAMLVAPLMTPLIGAGLALVHGNGVFLRRTLHTVFAGFLVALGIGVLIGWITGAELTDAMRLRAGPGPLDLAVAFASGMAAAYAIGRPGLSAALPGVAIAASLVPPIATAGLALTLSHFETAAGAALLFFTNIVAIVLGAALSLFLAGVRSEHLHRQQATWARRLAVASFVVAAIVAVVLCFWLHRATHIA